MVAISFATGGSKGHHGGATGGRNGASSLTSDATPSTASFRGVSLSEIGRHFAVFHYASVLGRRWSVLQRGHVGTRGLVLTLELLREALEAALAGAAGGDSLVSDQQQWAAWQPRAGRWLRLLT